MGIRRVHTCDFDGCSATEEALDRHVPSGWKTAQILLGVHVWDGSFCARHAQYAASVFGVVESRPRVVHERNPAEYSSTLCGLSNVATNKLASKPESVTCRGCLYHRKPTYVADVDRSPEHRAWLRVVARLPYASNRSQSVTSLLDELAHGHAASPIVTGILGGIACAIRDEGMDETIEDAVRAGGASSPRRPRG